MDEFLLKVSWCPICDQGWVEIVKDSVTNELFLACSECMSEWTNPAEITMDNVREEGFSKFVTEPTIQEVKEGNWDKYIFSKIIGILNR